MTTSRCAFESPFKTMTAYVAGHCRSDRQTCPLVRVYTQYNTASIRLSTDVTEVIAANAIFLRIQADSRLSRCGTYTKYLMYKSGQQRLAAGRENDLFFHCPPDGVRFKAESRLLWCDRKLPLIDPAPGACRTRIWPWRPPPPRQTGPWRSPGSSAPGRSSAPHPS